MQLNCCRSKDSFFFRRKLTQKELSAKAGVSLGSRKRFEQSGEI
ncbi:MAG: hypothetical protein PUB98_01405 [Clostridiales bacterium]|nr:hypothetical protein [Clostridiales bacterium]